VECRVEDGHVRYVWKRAYRSFDTGESRRVVERREGLEFGDRRTQGVVNNRRLGQVPAPVDDAMTHGPEVRCVHGIERLDVVYVILVEDEAELQARRASVDNED
jgi:hypothetical protein